MEKTKRDAFLALCELASKEDWCWKIPCTTCGSMYFRMSFLELINGKHPDDADWSVRRANHHNIKIDVPRRYSTRQQAALAEIVSKAKISEITKRANFPDWLGYLGLVLCFCSEHEGANRTLTRSLIPQFLEFITPHDPSQQFLEAMLLEGRTLSWQGLERVERAFLANGYREKYLVRHA